MNGLTLKDLHKSFASTRALNGISFSVAAGEIVAVLGPSGCGKSTLLAVIAGLETPDRGAVYWEGKSLDEVPPHQRGFGLMFQDYALFPHMSTFDNVAFGLRMSGMPLEQRQSRVAEMLRLVGLSDFGDRDVSSLSGGEQQRVALARSLAPQPRLLMLDEPLGSLDRTLRERLIFELREILRRMHQTAIYVTHDQEEALAIADRVVVMAEGEVVQIGTPQEIYAQPASTFVAHFLGLENLLRAQVRVVDQQQVLDTPIGELPVEGLTQDSVVVLIRPDAVHLDGKGTCNFNGTLIERSFRGSLYRAVIEVHGIQLVFHFAANTPLPHEGEGVQLSFDPNEALQVFSEP